MRRDREPLCQGEASRMNSSCESMREIARLPWYGVRVKSKHEHVASIVLRGKGYDPFLPLYRVKRVWSDRIKETELPLFPGYVFCRLDSQNRLPVLTATGVVGIVGIGKTPAPIEEREIEAIRVLIS